MKFASLSAKGIGSAASPNHSLVGLLVQIYALLCEKSVILIEKNDFAQFAFPFAKAENWVFIMFIVHRSFR